MSNAAKIVLFVEAPPGKNAQAAVAEFTKTAKLLGLPYAPRASGPEIDPAIDAQIVRLIFIGPVTLGRELNKPAEIWEISSLGKLSELVSGLIAVLLGGSKTAPTVPEPKKPEPPKKKGIARLGRETAGRRGKGVTVVWDLNLSETQLQELCTNLKNKCGTGGTVKDGRIEIQGDQRDRIQPELEKLGYTVKRSGG